MNTDLGTFVLDGDLGRIVAGDANLSTTGVVSLTAHSIGRFGMSTGALDNETEVQGKFGVLKTKSDIVHAWIKAGSFGTISIGGSLIGGNDLNSGSIEADTTLGTVTVAGDVIGGAGERSGYMDGTAASSITVGGDVIGSTGYASGTVGVNGTATNLTIGGSVIGGSGNSSGLVGAQTLTGTPKVAGGIFGGSGTFSGAITGINLATVSIGGNLQGGQANGSGSIYVVERLGTLTTGGSIIGGSASGAANLEDSGTVYAAQIGTLTLGGSLIAGTDNTTGTFSENGAIISDNNITSLTIKRNIIGNTTNPALIRAFGQPVATGTTDLAIGTLKVTGRVERARIVAGIGSSFSVNADAQIGNVTVGGDWIQSDLAAGIYPGIDGMFGTFDDAVWAGGPGVRDRPAVVSRINSVTIGGQVIGSLNFGVESWAITAQQIGTLKVGDATIPFSSSLPGELHQLGVFFNLSEIEFV